MGNKKETDKHLDTTVRQMDKKDKKTLFKTVATTFVSVLALCVLSINFFSCKMDSGYIIPEATIDYVALLENTEVEPVSNPTWQNVPDFLKTITKLEFLNANGQQITVRDTYQSGFEEGTFTLESKGTGEISFGATILSVHISEDGSIRLINSSNETLDFVKK